MYFTEAKVNVIMVCKTADMLSSQCEAVISSLVAALSSGGPSTVFSSEDLCTHTEDSLAHADSLVGEQCEILLCTTWYTFCAM